MPTQKITSHRFFKQYYGFVFVGVASTVLNYSVNTILVNCDIRPEIASAVGYVSGMCIGYPLNRYLVFDGNGNLVNEGIKYLSLYCFTFFVNILLAAFFFFLFKNINLPYYKYTYYLPVILVITILNFLGCKLIVFKK